MEYRKLGRFHIERSLAKGGMGEVVRTVDDSGRAIALKTILDTFRDDLQFQELFIREAEITFQLNHPNIVKAYRFERVGNRLILALEYLDGVNLKDVLRKVYDKNLQIPMIVIYAVMKRVLKGLYYAHTKTDLEGNALGILHRDLNPSNVFITYAGEVKILDFGISKATQIEVHQLTPKNELRGKICYLSPEQIEQKEIDHRSDIYALGILMWEAIAGKPLFVRDTDAQVMEAIVNGEVQSLQKVRPDVPEEVDQLVRKALRTNPKNRFQNCKDFEKALDAAFATVCMPGASEEEISVYVRSLFDQGAEKDNPQFMSGYAWLMLQVPGLEQKGLALAKKLAEEYPTRPSIQLNYARSLILKGDRSEGLRLLRRLARVDSLESEIQAMLEWLGVRRRPVIQALPRSNLINSVLGRVRHQILGPTQYQEQFLAA